MYFISSSVWLLFYWASEKRTLCPKPHSWQWQAETETQGGNCGSSQRQTAPYQHRSNWTPLPGAWAPLNSGQGALLTEAVCFRRHAGSTCLRDDPQNLLPWQRILSEEMSAVKTHQLTMSKNHESEVKRFLQPRSSSVACFIQILTLRLIYFQDICRLRAKNSEGRRGCQRPAGTLGANSRKQLEIEYGGGGGGGGDDDDSTSRAPECLHKASSQFNIMLGV